jgi:hypothetical protein
MPAVNHAPGRPYADRRLSGSSKLGENGAEGAEEGIDAIRLFTRELRRGGFPGDTSV